MKGGWFRGSEIQELFVPKSVEEIQDEVFAECKSLSKITLAEDSALQIIGNYSFRGSGLEEFQAPESLRVIQANAFQNCAALKRAVLNKDVEMYGNVFCDSGL